MIGLESKFRTCNDGAPRGFDDVKYKSNNSGHTMQYADLVDHHGDGSGNREIDLAHILMA